MGLLRQLRAPARIALARCNARASEAGSCFRNRSARFGNRTQCDPPHGLPRAKARDAKRARAVDPRRPLFDTQARVLLFRAAMSRLVAALAVLLASGAARPAA